MAILWRTIARLGMAAGCLATAILAGPATHAQSTWDGGGGDNNWGTGANWNGDQVPSFPTGLVFAGSTKLSPFNNLSNPTVRGITFDGTAGAFTVGGNGITIGSTFMDLTTPFQAGVNNGGATNSSASAKVVSLPLALSAGRHRFATDSGAGNLTLSGAITRAATSNIHFITNGGAINTTLTNNASGILGGWATIGVDPATSSYAIRDGSGNVVPLTTFSHTFGSDAFPAGTTLNSNVNFTGGGPLTIPAGAQLGTMLFTEQTTTVVTMTVTDTLTFANGGGIFRTGDLAAQHVLAGGTVTAGTTGAAQLFFRTRSSEFGVGGTPIVPTPGNGPPESLNINSQIVDNAGGGAVSVVKTGYGVMRLNNATNTFTGGLFVNEGQLRPTTAGAMGAPTSPVTVAEGAQVLLGAAANFPNPMVLAGFGPLENGGQAAEFRGGALRFNSANGEISGPVTLAADAQIGARGGQSNSAGTGGIVSGQITGPFTLRINRESNQGGATLDANMPTVTLANSSNNWTGNTIIGRGRTRIGGTGEVIPDGPGFGNVEMVGEQLNSATILNVNGLSETVNGLSASGDASLTFITNSLAATPGTIRIGNNNATSTFAGAILDDAAAGATIGVTKVGSGAVTLSSTLNGWGGDTKVLNGKLTVNDSAWLLLPATSDVHVTDGATFDLAFAGTKLVDNLYFGATPKAVGTWGSPTSAAVNKDARFTGTGLISVAALGTPLLAGDFDGDGKVDAADLTKWKAEFGKGGGADGDFDGDSDGNDFLVWQRQFGKTSPPTVAASAAVPEPGSLALLGLAAVGLVAANRKRD